MNRRDAALIAHLDAIETRLAARWDTFEVRLWSELRGIRGDIAQLREDVAGLKLELATHRHDDES